MSVISDRITAAPRPRWRTHHTNHFTNNTNDNHNNDRIQSAPRRLGGHNGHGHKKLEWERKGPRILQALGGNLATNKLHTASSWTCCRAAVVKPSICRPSVVSAVAPGDRKHTPDSRRRRRTLPLGPPARDWLETRRTKEICIRTITQRNNSRTV